jgi:hypothetical protein
LNFTGSRKLQINQQHPYASLAPERQFPLANHPPLSSTIRMPVK